MVSLIREMPFKDSPYSATSIAPEEMGMQVPRVAF